MVVEAVTVLPELPVADKVYVVVLPGVTVVEPDVPTAPIPGDMVTLLVLVVVQVRVTVWPTSTDDALALKELITGW
jgi:hypothetical protein